MKPYHKIITAWERDPATKHRTLIEGKWATPELAALVDIGWLWTEKIDGTNIRVHWDSERVTYGGKTDNAQIPAKLVSRLQEMFNNNEALRGLGDSVTLYGEGYGAKIQKGGGDYIPEGCNFILFDVQIGEWLLRWPDMVDVSTTLGIKHVPIAGDGPLTEAIEYVRSGQLLSRCATVRRQAEGLVMRPIVDLFDRRGERIITKIKVKDFR